MAKAGIMISHSITNLLAHYFASPVDQHWVMAMVVTKEGSSYRSPGAFMLVNGLGQTFGLVSGGCLEADIIRRANIVFQGSAPQFVEYDMLDEDSGYAADLGIGCKGKIGIVIQQITAQHRSLLQQLHERLNFGQVSWLLQTYGLDCDLILLDDNKQLLKMTGDQESVSGLPLQAIIDRFDVSTIKPAMLSTDTQGASLIPVAPPINLWVFGGGADAQPLVRMAASLGWRVTLVDHRPAYARRRHFTDAALILKETPESLALFDSSPIQPPDAAVLMSHRLTLDATWLKRLCDYHRQTPGQIQYIGLLGPVDRRDQVIALSEVADRLWLEHYLRGPAGFDIGGELPESIALSILAQCHQTLWQHQGGVL